ncbi:MAG: hypothetical protein IPM35_05040 [Myxococcales bacterium]|nr:hypothetical protein [Myxococcales bacterium]
MSAPSARFSSLFKLLGAALVGACSVFGSSLDHFTEGGEGGGGTKCPTGQTACGDTCVRTEQDPNNCGACGTVCQGAQVCDNGSCADACSGGRTDCDKSCVDTSSDPAHCGGCATFCTEAETCSSGKCSSSCATGQTQCGASCVDTQTSDQHCGTCSNNCGTGKKCQAGSCVVSCTTGQTLCDGACVDTQLNQNHCGKCGTACPGGQVCNAGECKIACPGGQTECSGLCKSLDSDDKNCGACGNACQTGEVCSNGQCTLNCATGETNCSGSCVNLDTNGSNCGACGTVCGANQECSAGQCVIACKTLLNQSIADPWGFSWDGLERPAGNVAAAKQTCEGIGGRLPTASELYRVSATQSATVGQTIHTNFLWSLVPYNAANHVRVRLSDANTSTQANTGNLNYRCVCPPPLPKPYVGGNCFGPAGTACYGLDSDGKRYNVDAQDRAPLSKGAAIWECAFYRGHLARPLQLAEAIKQGIGQGSNSWLHTADEVHYSNGALVSWKDNATWAFQYTAGLNALSWSGTTDFRPFRCAGVNYDAGTHPVSVADEYVGPLGGYKGETKDSPAAVSWVEAHDTCFTRGGHLPTAAELGELIQQGLPGGSGTWLWTSDQEGWNGSGFLVAAKRWTGTEPAHLYAYSTDLSWIYRHSTNPFRCIYYPVDTAFTGPASTACAGGCFSVTPGGSSGAKMWFDSFDRAPPAKPLDAIDVCRKAGGRLPSERDLTEAIRQGLPNGSSGSILTSDLEIGDGSNGGLLVGVVKWSGVDKTFTDQYSTYSNWGWAYNALPYRCMWTNELR